MKKQIEAVFVYATGEGFSGQRFASEQLIQQMREAGIKCHLLTTPALGSKKPLVVTHYIISLLYFYVACFWRIQRSRVIHINLGQSRVGLWREGFALEVAKVKKVTNTIVSLHGNVFMDWEPNHGIGKLFKKRLSTVNVVTVLGTQQYQKIQYFVPESTKVVNMPNTCELSPITDMALLQKHEEGSIIKLLYVSSFIDSKGYPLILEALEQIDVPHQSIELNLCGVFKESTYNERFSNVLEAKAWTLNKVNELNQKKENIKIIFHDHGVTGKLKERLFKEAHIFLLPTTYKVEAQPICLIEAMASGCAIITTKNGEITEMLQSERAGFQIDPVNAESLKDAITKILKTTKRLDYAQKGLKTFFTNYHTNKVRYSWEEIFRCSKN